MGGGLCLHCMKKMHVSSYLTNQRKHDNAGKWIQESKTSTICFINILIIELKAQWKPLLKENGLLNN